MASDDKQLRQWVSDQLMSLMGYSEPVVVKYIIRISKEASSPADIVSNLVESGCSLSAETRSFAEKLFAKLPHKQMGLSSYQKQEREAAMLMRKQKTYKLLDADDEDGDYVDTKAAVSQSDKSGSHRKHFRRKSEAEDIEDDEDKAERSERQVRRRTYQSDEDEDSFDSEEAMKRDQEEREQLERKIREKDVAATRKPTELKLSKKEEEEMLRRAKALEENDITNLRKVSRQEYVKKRKEKKLDELRDDILDEEYLFQGVELTDAEKREMRYKRKIYELAKKHSEDLDSITEYKMPDAYDQEGVVNQEKRFAAAMQRYRDVGASDKMNPFAEQEAWEEHQIGKATLKFGSKDRKKETEDYQFVFEDGIDFIRESIMDGTGDVDELPGETLEELAAKSMLQKLQDERKTLPIYKYRDELLKAINEYQVYDSWKETSFSTQWCYENYIQVRSMKRARDIRDQLEGLLERVEIERTSDPNDLDGIKKAITSGFFYHTGKLQKTGAYRTVKSSQTVYIHPSSGLAQVIPRWVVYHELVLTTKEYMRQVTEIKPDWLVEIAPHYYQLKDVEDDGSKKMPRGEGRSTLD